MTTTEHLTIRFASPEDDSAIATLSELDSAPRPRGQLLLAEICGELRAALPTGGGPAIADPFRPTADIVRLLELQRRQASGSTRRGRLRRSMPALRRVSA